MNILPVLRTFDPAGFTGEKVSAWLGPFAGNGQSGEPYVNLQESRLERINWEMVHFESALQSEPKEYTISAEKKRARLKLARRTILGGASCQPLWENYEKEGCESMLEKLRARGICSILFLGQPMLGWLGSMPRRYYLQLSYDGKAWKKGIVWEMDSFNGDCWVVATLPRDYR